MLKKGLFLFSLLSLALLARAQQKAYIYGVVKDSSGQVLAEVNIALVGKVNHTVSGEDGSYQLTVPAYEELELGFSYIGRKTILMRLQPLAPNERRRIDVLMNNGMNLDAVTVRENREREKASVQIVNPKSLETLPNVSGSFESILKTLPGVTSNNELSSQYNVRGGNYDENLVYVNDIEIYRPFLVRSGQQEGLSFINPDMVKNIKFSAGGFEARYGDKLSSVLDIQYKRPLKFGSNTSLSLLGANSSIEGAGVNQRFTYLIGARYRSNSYLLNSLDVQGDYKPRFADIQSYLTWHINDRSSISLLSAYSENRYLIIPQNRETVFGTVTNALKLNIGFEGQELMRYRTMMSGLSYAYQPNNHLTLKLISSAFNSVENEYFTVEGAYRLDQLEADLGSSNFARTKFSRGSGYFINHARNELDASVFNVAHRGYYSKGNLNLQWGLQYQHEIIHDKIHEWRYLDSADFAVPGPQGGNILLDNLIRGKIDIQSNRYSAYIQNSQVLNHEKNVVVTYGVRSNYWDLNRQNVLSPRIQASFEPHRHHNRNVRFNRMPDSLLKKDIVWKAAFGYYYQPPFYREIRDQRGEIHTDVRAQRAIHFVAGTDFLFEAWGRPFKFFGEAYYKKLDFLVPYEIDNVRIRYYAENSSKGFATGIDLRVNGEFLKGTESWASLSVMRVAENISNDTFVDRDGQLQNPGYIPRPTDQRVNFSLFFQDELASNPKYKMHLMLVYGSGLPFGPPNRHLYNDKDRMPPYRRVDIGFSKMLVDENMKERKGLARKIRSAWVSLEVFNLFQINNTISYFWVKDVTNTQYAVPNYLTSRRLNLALTVKI